MRTMVNFWCKPARYNMWGVLAMFSGGSCTNCIANGNYPEAAMHIMLWICFLNLNQFTLPE